MRIDQGLITCKTDGKEICHQRAEDGYLNATLLCKNTGKEISGWWRNQATQEFLEALASDLQIRTSELVQIKKGGEPHLQGTWIHPQIAINLGQWLSPKFAVAVSKWVNDWMSGKVVNPIHSTLPQINSDFLKQIADTMAKQEQAIQEKQVIIQNQQIKLKIFDEFKEAGGNVCLQTGAKELHLKPNLFIKRLKEKGYLIAKEKENLPRQSYINMGLFVIKTFTTSDGIESKQRRQTLLTPKGFHYFAHRILEEFSDIMNEPDKIKYASAVTHINIKQVNL